jgi:hypothetical protein
MSRPLPADDIWCPMCMLCSGTSIVCVSLSLVGLLPSLRGFPCPSVWASLSACCSFLLGRRFLPLGNRFRGRGVVSSGMGGTGIAEAAEAANLPVSSAFSLSGRMARGRSFLDGALEVEADCPPCSSSSAPGAFKQAYNVCGDCSQPQNSQQQVANTPRPTWIRFFPSDCVTSGCSLAVVNV